MLRSKANAMITVESKRTLRAPVDRVRAVLADVDHLERLMPRAERIEITSRNENRARIALFLRFSKIPAQRVEGEARVLEDGVRFIAVQPMQIDARYLVQPRDGATDVVARLATEIPKALAPFARLIPQRMIEERVQRELDASLDALQALVEQAA